MGNRKAALRLPYDAGRDHDPAGGSGAGTVYLPRLQHGSHAGELTKALCRQEIPYYEGGHGTKTWSPRILEDGRYIGGRLSGTHRAGATPRGSGKEDGKSTPAAENARAEGPAAALRRTALRAGGEDRHRPAQRAHTLPRPCPAIDIPSSRRCLRKTREELTSALERQPIDEDNARALLLQLAAEQYDAIGNTEYETVRLRRLLTGRMPMPELDAELLQSAVSKVRVTNNCVTVTLEERADHREERSAVNETAPRVIKIPAKPESVRQAELQRQLWSPPTAGSPPRRRIRQTATRCKKNTTPTRSCPTPCGPWRASSPTRASPAPR